MRRRDVLIVAGAAAAAESRARLAEQPDMAELLRCASLAPNNHNTQPWRFRVRAFRRRSPNRPSPRLIRPI